MDELLNYIGEQNLIKKLSGNFVFYSTSASFWQAQNVETIEQFEHWKAKAEFEFEYRRLGHKGFLPFDPDSLSTEQLTQEIAKIKG